jgi:hypothetical protein
MDGFRCSIPISVENGILQARHRHKGKIQCTLELIFVRLAQSDEKKQPRASELTVNGFSLTVRISRDCWLIYFGAILEISLRMMGSTRLQLCYGNVYRYSAGKQNVVLHSEQNVSQEIISGILERYKKRKGRNNRLTETSITFNTDVTRSHISSIVDSKQIAHSVSRNGPQTL